MENTTQFHHLQIQVQRKLNDCLQLAEQYFQRVFNAPSIKYNVRGLKAGAAYLQQNEIRLNRTLLLENTNAFINQVVPHELAHLIVYQHFGHVKPHGKEWQSVMRNIFCLPADTCHQFDTSNVQSQQFTYRCHCQIHKLSIYRHNKIQRLKAEYHCRKCRSKLYFVNEQF